MTAKRVQRDIQALSENLANCESMFTRVLRQKGEKPVIQRQSRSAVTAPKTDRDRSVTPIVTGPISRPSSPLKPPLAGKHLFNKDIPKPGISNIINSNSSVEVIMKAKSTKDGMPTRNPKKTVSASQLTAEVNNKKHANKKVEALKQTNINYEDHIRLPTKVKTLYNGRSTPNTGDKSKHLTWASRLKEQSKMSLGHTQIEDTEHEEERHVTSGASSLSFGTSSQSTFRNTSEAEDNNYFVNQGVQCGLSSSNFTGTATSLLSSQTAKKIGKDFSMINPVRLLNFLVKELEGKLDSNRSHKDDTEARQLLREIELTLERIPCENEVVPAVKPRKSVPVKETSIYQPSSPPERDIDSQTTQSNSRSQKEATAVKHVEAACKQLRNAQGCLQEEVKKSMLQISFCEKEGYLETIRSLKTTLENVTKKADDYAKMITDLSVLSTELRKENEVIPMLRATETKLYERIESFKQENQMLKTDIQNLKLELDKLKSALIWKDNELCVVKKEVTSLHQLVEDKMSGIKSLMPDFDKMFHNVDAGAGQNGYETDESTVTSDVSGPQRAGAGEAVDKYPVTSSPTSSANSSVVGDSKFLSWQKISNITNHQNSSCRQVLFANDISSLPSIQLPSVGEDNSGLLPISGNNRHASPPIDVTSPHFRTLRSTTLDHTVTSSQNATITSPVGGKSTSNSPVWEKSAQKIKHDIAINARLDQLDKRNEINLQQLQEKWNIKLPSPPREFSGKEPSGQSQLTDSSIDNSHFESLQVLKSDQAGKHKRRIKSKVNRTLIPNSSDESIIELFAKVDAYFADVKMNNESDEKNVIGSSGMYSNDNPVQLEVGNKLGLAKYLETKISSVKERTTQQVHENVSTMIGVAKEKTTQQLRDEVQAHFADMQKRENNYGIQTLGVPVTPTKHGDQNKMKSDGKIVGIPSTRKTVQHVGDGGDGTFHNRKQEAERGTGTGTSVPIGRQNLSDASWETE